MSGPIAWLKRREGSRLAVVGRMPAPGAATGVFFPHEWQPAAEVSATLASVLEAALVRAGLYPKEAAAMVKTWRASYFTEAGTRVLYLLPQAFTDAVLPLRVQPAPEEVVRVLVGRVELERAAADQPAPSHQRATIR